MHTIAHRGASGTTPENTLLAIQTAIECNADIVEFDIQLTKDKKVVVFHDRSFERITGEQEGVADYSLHELQSKDAGSWFNASFAGTKIPTLKETLQLALRQTPIIIEIKPQYREIEKNRSLEKLLLNALEDTVGVRAPGYISVRDEATYEWFTQECEYPIGLMQKKRSPEDFLQVVEKFEVEIGQIRWKNHTETNIEQLREAGVRINAFYADTPSEWNILKDMKVDGIMTNYPGVLKGFSALNW